MNSITESQVLQLITRLQDEGLSARRINLAIMVFKQILRAALRRRYLREDPVSAIRKLREPQAEVEPLDPHEVDAFLAKCPVWWRPLFAVAFWTGARPNELAALRWGDVDGARATFRIRAGRHRGVEGTPKTESSTRDVDMLPPTIAALREQRAQHAGRMLKAGQGMSESEKDYVFTGPDGGFLNINFLRDHVWYPTLRRAELRRRIMYQTRHTFASNALAAGESPTWVAAMLGHRTPEMLFRVYARYIPNRTRRDGSALVGHMTGANGLPRSTAPAADNGAR